MIRVITIVCLIVILFLCGVIFKMRSEMSDMEKAYIQKDQEIKMWKDKYGNTHAELETIRLHSKDVEKKLLDEIKKLTKIKPKNVERVVTATTHTTDTIPFYINKPRWSSQWATFEWLDSSRLMYSIRDSIVLVNHVKRYGFLGMKEKYVTRVVTFNPNTVITGMRSIEFVPPKRRISIGAHAGYGLQFSGSGVSTGFNVGVGVNVRLF